MLTEKNIYLSHQQRFMRLTLLFFCFVLLGLKQSVFSQAANIWIKPNAVWHYDFDSFNGTFGFVKTEYVGDTLIEGQSAQILTSNRYLFFYDINGILHLSDIQNWPTNYTRNNENQVFYWFNNQFELLYDFTKAPGESYTVVSIEPTVQLCNPSSTVTVQSISNTTIGNQTYPTIELDSDQANFSRLNGQINARYGNQTNTYTPYAWLFPLNGFYFDGTVDSIPLSVSPCDPNLIIDYIHYKFRCFQDDSLTVNPNNEDCEYLLNNVGMTELNDEGYMLFPNPATNFITLVAPFEENEVTIYNAMGNLVLTTKTSKRIEEIPLNLPSGTYFLKSSSNQSAPFSETFVIR
jgi:hypothetical protein